MESGRADRPQRWRNCSKSGGTDGAHHTRWKDTQPVSEREVTDAVATRVKLAVVTSARARPDHDRTKKQPLSKSRALPPRLAFLRRLAFRAPTARSRATACNFKTLEATFNSYFLNFRKVQLICHLLGLFPREVIKWSSAAMAGATIDNVFG